MTKAFPDWTVSPAVWRFICVAVTFQCGVLDWAVQPSVSWPVGPLTYAGVISTGESSEALTRSGFVA
jgi:hypothetical protein